MTNAATVLISEPQGATGELQFDNAKPYLPYVWAILKSYAERYGVGREYEWLDPLWRLDSPEAMLAQYAGRRIDVLGLSCYTWNWEAQCLVAQEVKARHPECLVVAGGPEPDYKDPAFFEKHPYIDVVVVKDGEHPFSEILRHLASGEPDLTGVGGLYLPGRPDSDHHTWTGPAQLPTDFDYSPYLDQHDYYQRLMDAHEEGWFDAVVETNRGCPYGCSFCDWGSNTMSKVRRFDMSRIAGEIDWLGRMRVGRVMLADANFGILPRDIEIADLFNAAREQHSGYPQFIFYSAAKNNPDRSSEIALRFARSGICTIHALSIQHTRKEVLEATNRSNISAAKQMKVVETMMAAGVPIEVQLIQGIPGDTYDLWKDCLADLMEWGVHEDYLIQAYRLLPNAPASEPEFLSRWEVRTIERIMYDLTSRQIQPVADNFARKREKVVVGSRSYSLLDWVRMSTYSAFVKCLHNSGLTQNIAMYLRLTHGVGYRDFYEHLIDNALPSPAAPRPWYQRITDQYERYLTDDDASDHMIVADLPQLPIALHPSRWAFVEICLQIDQFFEWLTSSLCARYPDAQHLAAVIEYQRNLVILPDYDRRSGRTFSVDLDWMSYFHAARARSGEQSMAEPEPIPGTVVRATDRRSGERPLLQLTGEAGYFGELLDWDGLDPAARWHRWIVQTVVGRSSAPMHNLQELAPVRAGEPN
jgi:putative methyltransferase